MSKINDVKLPEDVYKEVRKMADRGIGNGKNRKTATLAEMAAALITTGVYRRIAANKWAKAHPPKKAAPRKVKARSAKKAAPRKAKAAKKAPRKAKAAPTANGATPASAPSVLD